MTIKTAYSIATDPKVAARELRTAIGDMTPTFIVFFATPTLDPEQFGEALEREFGEVAAIGCTTAGEIISGKMLSNSVVLMAADAESILGADVASIPDPTSVEDCSAAMRQLEKARAQHFHELDPEKYVGLVLHDGMQVSEERVMATLSSSTNVPFVGGSAGDNRMFEGTHVFAGFKAHAGGSALALVRPNRPYRVFKTQSLKVCDAVLEATEVNEATRTVISFNNRPAAEEYASVLGVSPDELPAQFQSYPLGLVVGEPQGDDSGIGNVFTRSAQQKNENEITFFCQVKEGMQLHLLEAGDILDNTRRDLDRALTQMDTCSGILNFNCIQRTMQLEDAGLTEEYGQIFSDVPTIGFSTYGESFIGHINQTATMILFG